MSDKPKKFAVIGNGGAATAALLAALAESPGPSPIYSGKAAPKPQRVGPPKLTGKRLERLRKQALSGAEESRKEKGGTP